MPATTLLNVKRQVTKVRRRLLVQTLLDTLVWCWAAALLAGTLWFLAQPWLLGPTEDWVRWSVAGGILAAATITGIGLGMRRAPSAVEAALELDVRFNLKERVTTSYTLVPQLRSTAAGEALTADADSQVARVKVRQGFPLRLSRGAALVPACAAVLVLVALFYNPVVRSPEADGGELRKAVNAKEIAEKLNNYKKQAAQAWPKDQDDDKLAEIDKLRDKLLNQPFDPTDKDQLREKLQQMLSLEDKLKNRLDDLKGQQDRSKSLQEKLKAMGKDPQREPTKDGPAKDLEDALNRGDLEKAQKEIMALAEKLKQNKLSDEERRQLQKQLEQIQQQLERLADLGQLKDQLRKDLAEGRIDQDEFKKLMARAGEDAQDMWEMHEIGKLLGEAKGALGDGEMDDAADRLIAISKYIADFDPTECERCETELQDLEDFMGIIRQSLRGGGPLPGGQRPIAEEMDTKPKLERQRGDLSAKTQFMVTGVQKGGTFKKIPANQVSGAFKQAQQDAPDAIERQQVPPDAAEMLRGYYENLGGSKKK
jgi:hypothetical protein